MNYKKYIPAAITVIIAFLIIKTINNYTIILSIVNDFISTIMPFIVGLLLAYALSPAIRLLENKYKMPRSLSILTTFIILGIIITSIMLFIIPVLLDNIVELANQIPSHIKQIESFIYNSLYKIENITSIETTSFFIEHIENFAPSILEISKGVLTKVLTTTVSLTNFIIDTIVAVVICVYTLIDKEKFIAYFKKINKIVLKNKEHITINFFKTCNEIIGKYIIAIFISSCFVGTISTIFLLLIGAKYAVLTGVLIGLTNMIPFFGPFISGIPTVILNLFYSRKLAIIVAIFIIVLQQIDGNIISPKIVGDRIGINPFLTLLSITVGGHYFGVLGMVLGIPLTGILKIYLDEFIKNKENNCIIIKE